MKSGCIGQAVFHIIDIAAVTVGRQIAVFIVRELTAGNCFILVKAIDRIDSRLASFFNILEVVVINILADDIPDSVVIEGARVVVCRAGRVQANRART